MSKNILEKLDLLQQELITLEKSILNKKTLFSDSDKENSSEIFSLQKQLREEQSKNKKANNIIDKNIEKLERLIEKEEKNHA